MPRNPRTDGGSETQEEFPDVTSHCQLSLRVEKHATNHTQKVGIYAGLDGGNLERLGSATLSNDQIGAIADGRYRLSLVPLERVDTQD